MTSSGIWPSHLSGKKPHIGMTDDEIRKAMFCYFKHNKGNGSLADFVCYCKEEEMPQFIKDVIYQISKTVYPIVEECTENNNIPTIERTDDEV